MKFRRIPIRLLIIAAALVLPGARSGAAESPAPPGGVFRMTVRPKAPGKPALAYKLLPEISEQKPGNAAAPYLMALVYRKADEQMLTLAERTSFPRPREGEPLAIESMRRLASAVPRGMIDGFDIGARRERVDWGLTLREQGFEALLPHLQGLRDYSVSLAVMARVEAADGRFDSALRHVQTGLAVARHLNEEAVLVQQLVAVNISARMLETVRDMMQHPDAPNLYWALADLPRPFHDIRGALEWERSSILLTFPGVGAGRSAADFANLSEEEFRRSVAKLSRMIESSGAGFGPPAVREDWGVLGMSLLLYPEAKRFFTERGEPGADVRARPPHQVIAQYMVLSYRELADEVFKWHSLPYWVSREPMRKADATLRQELARHRANILLQFLPALTTVRYRSILPDRVAASLQTVEALRAYAAANDGQLPVTLADLTDTPAPLDPATGQPFGYELRGSTAVIDVSAPHGERMELGWKFEVTIAR